MKLEPNFRILVTGKTQSGKTHWTKRFLMSIKNYIIYDTKREYGQQGTIVHSLEMLHQAIKQGHKRIVVQPVGGQVSVEFFDEVCKYVYYNVRNCMLVVDEVQLYCTKSNIPQWFKALLTVCQAPEYGIGVTSVTQRPANVHNDVISQSSVIVTFKQNLRNDAEAISGHTGIPSENIQNLPYRWFYIYNDRLESAQHYVQFRPLS